MKKLMILFVLIAMLAAGAGYLAGQRQQAPAAAEQPARKVLYWYDPMVPDQRFDKPGKSPFMDMDLQPRYADDAPEAAGVAVSARQQQNLGMTTARAQMRVMAPAFSAYATVTTDERSIQIVPAPASGVVESLTVRAPQQWVKAGDPLARLWIPAWTAAQQEYLAVRQLGDATLTQAARARLALQFMPDAIVRELERSGKPQTRLTLRATRDGYVVKLDAREGARVEATQPLFELASLDPVWLVVDYAPAEMQTLSVGSEIIATADSLPGEAFRGRVSELLPQLETTTRTLKARIVLDNPQHKLKPGMFLTVALAERAARPPVLAVPEEAVIDTGTQSRLLLATGDGHFQAVNVTTGITSGGWTQILTGVKTGDSVVTSGQFLIDSEASLRSALPQPTADAPPVAAPAMEHQHDHNHAMHGGEVMP